MGQRRDSLLPGRDEPVLPVTDRETPLVDRVRERRNGEGEESVGSILGDKVGEMLLMDGDRREEESMKFLADFRTSLSNTLGVEKQDISNDIIKQLQPIAKEIQEEDVIDQDEEEDQEVEKDEEGSRGLVSESIAESIDGEEEEGDSDSPDLDL